MSQVENTMHLFSCDIVCKSKTEASSVAFIHSPESMELLFNGNNIDAKFYLAAEVKDAAAIDESDDDVYLSDFVVYLVEVIKNGELVTDELELEQLANVISDRINGEH